MKLSLCYAAPALMTSEVGTLTESILIFTVIFVWPCSYTERMKELFET